MKISTLPSRNRNVRRRTGFVSLEVILVLPLLLILLLGLLQFSLLFLARGQVIDAAHAGVRLAALHGVEIWEIEEEVRHSLGSKLANYALVDIFPAEHSGEEVLVEVRVPMAAATPDLLWPIGYSIRNQSLIAHSRMLKE